MNIGFNKSFGWSVKQVKDTEVPFVPFSTFTLIDRNDYSGSLQSIDAIDNKIGIVCYDIAPRFYGATFDGTTITRLPSTGDPSAAAWGGSFDDNSTFHLGMNDGANVKLGSVRITDTIAAYENEVFIDPTEFNGVFSLAIPGTNIVIADQGVESKLTVTTYDDPTYTIRSVYGTNSDGKNALLTYDKISGNIVRVYSLISTGVDYLEVLNINTTTYELSSLGVVSLGDIHTAGKFVSYNNIILVATGTTGNLQKYTFNSGTGDITLNYSTSYGANEFGRCVQRLNDSQYILTMYGGGSYAGAAYLVDDSGSSLTLTKQTQLSSDVKTYQLNYSHVHVLNNKTYLYIGGIAADFLIYEVT